MWLSTSSSHPRPPIPVEIHQLFSLPTRPSMIQSEPYGQYKSCTVHADRPSHRPFPRCFQCLLYAIYGMFSHIDSRWSTFVHISTVLEYSYFSWTLKQSSHNSQYLFQALKLPLDRNFPFHGPALVTTLMNPKPWIYVWTRIPSSSLLVQSNEMISWRELWILHSTILYFQRKFYVRSTSCRTKKLSERIHLVSDSPVARMSWIHRFSSPVNPPHSFLLAQEFNDFVVVSPWARWLWRLGVLFTHFQVVWDYTKIRYFGMPSLLLESMSVTSSGLGGFTEQMIHLPKRQS